MAQRRMISKSISVSRKLARTSQFGALLFTWMIPHCDDGGNIAGDAETIKALVVPARPETIKDVETAIKEIIKNGLVDPYTIGDDIFLHIVNWEEHQTLRKDRATWEYPAYPKDDGCQPDNQLATSRQPVGNRSAAEGKVREGKVSKDKTYTSDFDEFWNAYPLKVSKGKAFTSWQKIKMTHELRSKIMESLESQKKSEQWTKDDGRFIPHPTTWLNQERWDYKLEVPRVKTSGKFDGVRTIKS